VNRVFAQLPEYPADINALSRSIQAVKARPVYGIRNYRGKPECFLQGGVQTDRQKHGIEEYTVNCTIRQQPLAFPPFLGLNKDMTAAEKTSLARFFDLAAAVTGSGYRSEETEYHFTDDTVSATVPLETPTPKTDGIPTALSAMDTTGADMVADMVADSLERVAADVRSCTACGLCDTRKNAVPGEGVPRPAVMVIGEAPGADEDATGRPFVGKAGQLLDKMLAAIELSRETNCFIANVIKCRPPANRDPQPQETAACASFLRRQIQLLQPRFMLCAGRISAQTLLNTSDSIGKLRGRFIDFPAEGRTIPLLVTYHPSALLRNEDYKRPAWEDLKLLRSELEKTST
jgi:DNA polymerase